MAIVSPPDDSISIINSWITLSLQNLLRSKWCQWKEWLDSGTHWKLFSADFQCSKRARTARAPTVHKQRRVSPWIAVRRVKMISRGGVLVSCDIKLRFTPLVRHQTRSSHVCQAITIDMVCWEEHPIKSRFFYSV